MTQTPFVTVFALYPNLTQLDFTGPHQVLSRIPGATTLIASREGGDIEAEGGLVKVRANGNKLITEVHISPQLLQEADAEHLEDLLLTAVNRVLQQAEAVHTAEMQAIAAQAMGGMPNLGF